MTQVAVPAAGSAETIPMEARIVGVAVDLFASHGIDATSLQMIADALGITKGAVYYHFKTKHEIVLAVCADSFDALEAAVAEGETIESVTSHANGALDRLVPRLVTLAVESRSVFSKLRFDPVMVRLMADDPVTKISSRLDRLLGGDAPTPKRACAPRRRSPRWRGLPFTTSPPASTTPSCAPTSPPSSGRSCSNE